MRIAMISEHASPLATIGGVDAGGQNIYVAHVARSLALAGHEVDVLTRRDCPRLPARVDLRPGARVLHIDAGPARHVPKEDLLDDMPAFARAAERLMRNSAPYDVVHANFFMSGWVARRLQRVFGTPFVMTFHALGKVRLKHQKEADAFPPERLEIEDELVRHASAVIAECPQDRSDLIRLYGADPRRLHSVPCGVDLQEFGPVNRAAARAALGLSAGEFIVLQLGRIVPRKGIDNAIRAIGELPGRVPARLLVVGGNPAGAASHGAEMRRLGQVAVDCGAAAKVDFIGHRARDELKLFYAAADVFVTTPWYEPFGITPLEAMACGTPVIGSAVGGIKYSVVDGVTGLLVPPHRPAALAARLVELHDNPVLARSMGKAGIERVRAQFTWDHVARQLARVYAEVRHETVTELGSAAPPPLRTAVQQARTAH